MKSENKGINNLIDILAIDEIMKKNNQYNTTDSDLWRSIDLAFDCGKDQSIEYGYTHCNSLSFYTICYARGFIQFHYSTWLKRLYSEGLVSREGYLQDKLKIAKFFAFDDEFSELKYFYDYDDCMNAVYLDKDKAYNIKVESNSGHGFHFMAAYVFAERLFLSDSSGRGICVLAEDLIPKNKFKWILEV